MMPSKGCGSIVATFNRLYSSKNESVSKTFVYEKLKANKYQLTIVKRDINNKPPYSIPVNRPWGVDLTTVNLSTKQQVIWDILYARGLQVELDLFQVWYNHVRVHSNLNDQTPAEFFTKSKPKAKPQFVSDWDGVLSGYYFPD